MESNERLYGKKVFIVSREEEENEKRNEGIKWNGKGFVKTLQKGHVRNREAGSKQSRLFHRME